MATTATAVFTATTTAPTGTGYAWVRVAGAWVKRTVKVRRNGAWV